MTPNPKTYLFIGEDLIKQKKIEEINSKFLNPQNKDFNYDLIYTEDLEDEYLKDRFNRYPVAANFRVLRIKEVDAFSANNRETLLSYLKSPHKSLILILESNKEEMRKDTFLKKLSTEVDFFHAAKREPQINVFDLCKAMINKNTALALRLLKKLDVDSRNAPKIMGGIIWQWEQLKHLLSAKDLKESFKTLYEADKHIKTGKLKPDLALQMLVVSLSSTQEERSLF